MPGFFIQKLPGLRTNLESSRTKSPSLPGFAYESKKFAYEKFSAFGFAYESKKFACEKIIATWVPVPFPEHK
ncbi:hypothetical protein SAMN04488126_10435 [Bhargavaea beijingensis]|uniref:Uncharacterized protein n=1 Tax=Bhargavaea beijingensis TaxID=426756 RepID=A0A1G7AIS1_9BACL|nr:hypothetical protein SAMN04488126_10435 [Bhargavaea beijingensis]